MVDYSLAFSIFKARDKNMKSVHFILLLCITDWCTCYGWLETFIHDG